MIWRALIFSCFLFFAPAVLAADGGETMYNKEGKLVNSKTGEDASDEGKGCDFDEFIKKLAERESGGSCTVVNQYGYMGKYQFGKAALADIGYIKNGAWTGKNGIWSKQDFLNSCSVQDTAVYEWMDHMAGEIRSHGLDKYIGKTIKGCEITWSGLLAGRHLKGIGNSKRPGLKHFLESDGAVDGKDGNGVGVSNYVCKFKGYKTPYDAGKTYGECGGGEPYPGTPGSAKPPTEEEYYGPGWDPSPEVRHYKLLERMIQKIWIAGMQLMTQQLTAVMMKQAEIVGSFFDAKHQLETQRLLQQRTARAHKDYHPSEQMCTIGTFARNLANTDRRATLSQISLSQRAIQREMLSGDSITIEGRSSDKLSRFNTFREKFCDKRDNAGGLDGVCKGTPDPAMKNRDINYTLTIDTPLTFEFDPLEPTGSDDELAVFSLMDNLFAHIPPPLWEKNKTTRADFTITYQNLRSIIAMRSVARNSMNNILAQKGLGPETEGEGGSNAPYLRALMKEMGITDEEEITKLLGERPSYWAQMELLTKTLYQHPNFSINLYDKPANVARMRASMRAIKTMQDRDIYEALVRREMLLSMLSELAIRREQSYISSMKPTE